MLALQNYQAPSNTPWQGRKDSLPGERYFQCVTCVDLEKSELQKPQQDNFVLLGFCCDAGIARNHGRVGAAEGPLALRKALANLALPFNKRFQIYDVGDITCANDNLESAQQSLSQVIGNLLKQKHCLAVLGGGHEMAWAHYQGIREAYPNDKIGIINIDAHFDVRPLIDDQKGSSGTSFLQIANDCKKRQLPFSYLCIGVQENANTNSLWQTMFDLKAEVILAKTLQEESLDNYLPRVTDFIAAQNIIYLTVCLDVFAAAVAPGVSAPQAAGLFPWQLRPLLKAIIESGKMISFDIAELSPPYDLNHQTAQLAANCLTDFFRWMSHNNTRNKP